MSRLLEYAEETTCVSALGSRLLAEETTCVLALGTWGSWHLALGSMRREYLNRMLFVRHIRFSYSFGVLCAELLALGSRLLALGARNGPF